MEDNNSFLPTLQPIQSGYMLRTKKLFSRSTHQSLPHLYLSSTQSHGKLKKTKDDDVQYSPYSKDDKKCFKQLLDQSKDEQCIDKQDKPVIGTEALQKYYKHLKILDKVKDENSLNNNPDSVYTVMLTSAKSQKLLPCKVGLLKYEGTRDTIKLNNMKYGDKYIGMLQEGIQKSNQLQIFELTGNRITQHMAGTLLQSLAKNAREIILSQNRIGQIGITNISNQLKSKDCRIEVLDLEDNSLGNLLIKELCYNIQFNKTIQKLNLSKNFITNSSCQAISSMLQDNTNIQELYLFWNQIKGEGGIQIFRSLNTNIYLKVLDMSQNSLGLQQSCAMAFSELIVANTELQHVDLSFNYLNLKDTQIIADGLKQNKTIYGFHYSGNRGYVDSKGFLIPIDEVEEDQGQQQIALRIRGCKYQNQQRIRQGRDQILKDCCWICEGWRQQSLWWKPGVSGSFELNPDPTFIHLSYQDYGGLYFGNPIKGLKLQRMLPPGFIKYFFTVGGVQTLAMDQPKDQQSIIMPNVKYAGQELTVYRDNLNEIYVSADKLVIDQYYDPQIIIKPRTRDWVYTPPKKITQKKIWNFQTSLFRPWVRETEQEDIIECFEYDWNCSRISKIIKTEQDLENTKSFMKSIYHQIKDTYRHYSSFNPVGEVWAIQSSTFTQILSNSKLVNIEQKDVQVTNNSGAKPQQKIRSESLTKTIDEKQNKEEEDMESVARKRIIKATIKATDLDLKFISTISGTEKGNPRKPDRGMIRFQFLELWVRIAEAKYINNQITINICDSMKYLWEDHLKQEFILYAGQLWRDQRYWNENCDQCLKHYKSILDHVFSMNSKKKVKPGQKAFMSVQEFNELCQQAGLQQYELFSSSAPLLSFNKAMMTQIDEVKSDRGFQMSYVEFLEAFSRIADDTALPPYVGAFPDESEFPYQALKDLPLHYKIESLCLLFLEHCVEASFFTSYKKPDKSYFTPELQIEDEERD